MAALTLGEQLDQLISDEDILYGECFFNVAHGWYRKDSAGEVILINSAIDNSFRRNYAKGHELGHHFTGYREHDTFDKSLSARRAEHRADQWALLTWFMPMEKLIAAYEYGARTPFELVDYLGIPVEEFYRGLEMYFSKFGHTSYFGQYVITWSPFNIKLDKRRKTEVANRI